MSDITATVTSTPITATATSSGVSAAVSSSSVSASAGGGIGPQGPAGPAGPAGSGGSAYTLPPATSSTLGGVKVGANVSAAADGTISVAAPVTSLAASAVTGLATVATSGAYADLTGKPTIPAATTSLPASSITGLAAVATTGAYADLSGLPAIPGAYSLPAASSSLLGGIKAGDNVSVAEDGTLSVAAPTTTLAASSVTGLAAVATSGSAADLSVGVLPAARLPSTAATYSALAAAASQASSALDVYPRGEATALTIGPASGSVFFTWFTAPTSFTVSAITMASGNIAASGLTLCRFGLYTYDETTATLVARTASDTTIFAAVNSSYQRSLSTVGGYPATYTLTAGTRYGVAVVIVGTTAPTLAGKAIAVGVSTMSPKTNGTITGQSDLPATATSIGTAQGHPFGRLT